MSRSARRAYPRADIFTAVYLGHIPVFADIHISRYLKEPYTEPSNFATIFERGIDPDMDDPTKVG